MEARATFLAVCLSLFFAAFSTASHAADYRDVIINELNWAGSSASTADEWIELKNLTGAAIDISNWRIEGAATSGGTLTIPAGSVIPAQGFFLIANFAATSSSSTLNVAPDWVTTSVSLRNSNVFYRMTDETGKHIDEADDGSGAPLAGDNTTKASMERNRYVGGGTVAGGWHNSYQFVNFDSGVSQLGSPKAENNALPTVAIIRVSPGATGSGEKNRFKLDYEIYDPDGIADIIASQIDLTDLGANRFDLNIQSSYAEYIIEPLLAGARNWTITVGDSFGGIATITNTLTVFQGSLGLQVSEVLPRPQEGSDFEWIELYNSAGNSISLTDYQLDDIADSGSSPYKFPAGTTISARSFLVIEKSDHSLNLNDDGDQVRLLDPAGNRVAETTNWGDAAKGSSFALIDGSWQLTTQLTKGSANLATPTSSKTQTATTSEPTPTSSQTATQPSQTGPDTTAEVEKPEAQPFDLAQGRPIEPLKPSKKLVKGVKIIRQEAPAPGKKLPYRNAGAAVVAILLANESVLLWSKRQTIRRSGKPPY